MSKQDTIISLLKEIDENIDNIGGGGNVPKVKVSTLRVANSCINDNGVWEGEELLDTSTITSLQKLFEDCTRLRKFIGNWNTSKVTNMESTFTNCSNLETLDLSSWDISNVITLRQTFDGCSKLKSINTDGWNTSKVTNMESTFANCSNLETLDLSSWDISNVITLRQTFNGCSKLKSINTDGWDISKVTDLTATFSGTGVESLDLSHWNTSNVTTITLMFVMCSKLKRLNTYGWNTSNITYVGRPFNGAPIKFIDFRTWNAEKMLNLTNDVNGLFYNLPNLTTFIGDVGIEEVITNNISALNGAKVNIILTSSKLLDRASLRALINGLADLTGSDTKTLTLGETLIAKLTEEDIAIATAKNWTIA